VKPLAVALLASALVVGSRAAAADPAPGDPAFVYTTPATPDYARMAVEEALVLGIGFAQYNTTKSNEADWDVDTSWSGVRSKLLWGAASFDDNRFDTNWLTHPLAGFFYYSAARSNRVGVFASLAVTVAASALWEEIGELREEAAINDMIVTPFTALPLGESALQLGSFFQRGRHAPWLVALGWAFAPFKAGHDTLDGLTTRKAEELDDLGMPADVWHRFAIGGDVGVTMQQRGVQQLDVRGALQTELVTVPGYRRPGTGARGFSAGEVTALRFRIAEAAGSMVDLDFGASTVPAGWFTHDVRLDEAGELHGGELLGGLLVSAEYTHHDYDRDGRRANDRLGIVGAGVRLDGLVHAGAITLRTTLDLVADFAGVDAYALPEHRAAEGEAGLTSVLRQQGYYHAFGTTMRPAVEIARGPFAAGADARLDAFRAIANVDVHGFLPGEIVVNDRRLLARAWVGITPVRHLRLVASVERNERAGAAGAARAARSEIGIHTGLELVF
jgi:hypothetical protein